MLPDSKIPQLISLQIPGLSCIMQQLRKTEGVCKVMDAFAAYTRNMICAGQLQETRKCFTVAAVLYRNGSRLLQHTIESVYLHALSPLLDTACSSRPVKELLPLALKNIRAQHTYTGTI